VLARAGRRGAEPEEELAQIEAALRRIDEGRYGICDGCGAALGAQMLLDNPARTHCGRCQPQGSGQR